MIIILFDTFSYLTGNFFGNKKIFLYLSPKKTLEGLLGGLFFTNLIILFYINFNFDYTISNFIFINLIIIFALIGDVTQSYFKRLNTLKDSSNFLPGHGGFFDRFDSFFMCIIFLFTYSYIF